MTIDSGLLSPSHEPQEPAASSLAAGLRAADEGRRSRSRPWQVQMAGWLGAALAFSWAMNLIWWGLLSPDARPPTVDAFEIPLGTAAAIANGTAFAFVPNQFSLPPGGRLRIRNADVVDHTVGNATIPPGAVAEITAPEGGGFTCTIHPSGYIGISLTRRPPITATLLPTLFLGLPLGLLGGAAIVLAKRLG